jgi:hypothetical protein
MTTGTVVINRGHGGTGSIYDSVVYSVGDLVVDQRQENTWSVSKRPS